MKTLESLLLYFLEYTLKACIYLFFSVILFITWGIIGVAWVGALPVVFVCYFSYTATKVLFNKVQSLISNFTQPNLKD